VLQPYDPFEMDVYAIINEIAIVNVLQNTLVSYVLEVIVGALLCSEQNKNTPIVINM
jgi:hypothetical protein